MKKKMEWRPSKTPSGFEAYSLYMDERPVAFIHASENDQFHWLLLDAPRWEHNGYAPTKEKAQATVEDFLTKAPNLVEEVDRLRLLLLDIKLSIKGSLQVAEILEKEKSLSEELPSHLKRCLISVLEKLESKNHVQE